MGLELLTVIVTVMASVALNSHLLRAEQRRTYRIAGVVVWPIVTLVSSVGLGLLTSRGYLYSYTQALH